MPDPVPSSAIYDATTGGLSVIVVTGGSTGDVLMLQNDGTYDPITLSQSNVSGLTAALAAKADLVGGLVPANQLPSYVDDVIESANQAALPVTGETGKIYVTLDTGKTYRWSGSAYVELTDATAVWGQISGTLSNQTDLNSALSGKQATLVSGTNIKTVNSISLLGSGDISVGMAIGSTVTSATAGSVLFAGVAGVLAQDNASLFFDDTNNRLGIGTASPTQALDVSNTGTASQIRYRWASDQCLAFGGDGTQGPYLVSHTNPNDTSFGAYAAVKLNFGASGFIVSIAPSVAAGGARTFTEACRISSTTQIGLLTCTSASLKGLVVKAAASQTANLQEWQDSSAAVLSAVAKNGALKIVSLANSAAENSTLYYSTDAAKLVWKDAGGTVNNLY